MVHAALAVVDKGGPDALSIRAVAAHLGVRPNALYTYVASRAALEGAVVEQILRDSDITALTAPGEDWQSRLLAYASSVRAALLRHPGVARLMMTAPMNGPTALLVGERMIEALSEAGVAPEDAARGAYTLIVQVVGAVALEVAETDGTPPLPPEHERIAARRQGLQLLDPADWPMTTATAEIAAQWNSAAQFTWSVGCLLEGIAALARSQQHR